MDGFFTKPQTATEAIKEMPGLLRHMQPEDLASDDTIKCKVTDLWADGHTITESDFNKFRDEFTTISTKPYRFYTGIKVGISDLKDFAYELIGLKK